MNTVTINNIETPPSSLPHPRPPADPWLEDREERDQEDQEAGPEESDNDSAMSPSQRYVLTEQEPYGQLPVNCTKSSAGSVRSSSRSRRWNGGKKMVDQFSLNELDEAVASVGKLYQSPRRPGDLHDDYSSTVSVESQSIATGDGHSIYSQQNLIANMHLMMKGHHHQNRIGLSSGTMSLKSGKSSQSKRSRSSRRSRKRRTRGASLERTISETILAAVKNEGKVIGGSQSQFVESFQEEVAPASSSVLSSASTEFILHDLHQVSAIIESEVASHVTSDTPVPFQKQPINQLHNHHSTTTPVDSSTRGSRARQHRYACTPLLPPIASESCNEEDEDEDVLNPEITAEKDDDDNSFVKFQNVDFFTPNTSNENRSTAIDDSPQPNNTISPSSPHSYSKHVSPNNDPFEALDRHGIKSLWERSEPVDSAEVQPPALPPRSNNKQDPTELLPLSRKSLQQLQQQQNPNEWSPEEASEFLDSVEWTTFKENPFAGLDTASVESPNSIADFDQNRHHSTSDFTHVRPWKTSESGWKHAASKVFV